MQVSANHPDSRNDLGLQLSLREQNQATPLPSQRLLPPKEQQSASSTERKSAPRAFAYSTYSSGKIGGYQQAIRAYQESARFEQVSEGGSSIGNIFGTEPIQNERVLTDVLRGEPRNSAAWSELGVLYHSQGQRDKVGAIYQILKELDSAKADAFATQAGLHEKVLFTIA